jgi:tRNA(Ile)-lysidine synthase
VDRSSAVDRLRPDLAAFAGRWLPDESTWCVALSGGPDSLALTALAATIMPTTALIVDHGLQPGSDAVARRAQATALDVGCVHARVLRVQVGTGGGLEAAARSARYAALDEARNAAPVLLGHTLDDQAETVLLGLGRGSGARSIAGMWAYDRPWCRPLLGVRRSETLALCSELGLEPWQDPHNVDRRFTRVRLREEVLPLLEDVLGGGVAAALARTASSLREDTDALDDIAAEALAALKTADGLPVVGLEPLRSAIRRRVIRRWLLDGGAVGLTDKQIRAVDALVTAWRGQGGVAVGSGMPLQRLFIGRRERVLVMYVEPA